MEKSYAEKQLALAKQHRDQGNESAARDAALRASSNVLDLPMDDVGAGVETADEAIELAERDVTREIIDNL
ncbi:MAG: hypothetical protein ACFCBU_01335 [Cyanophyceae cyanobacterium]